MNQLYICKVHVENYRNFHLADFDLCDKQVIIGENNVGKSNLLRAIQLILDPTFSDEDRMLDEADFFDGLDDPMENDQEIIIDIFIDNYVHIKNVLCQLSDATVDLDGKKLLKLTYKYYPQEDAAGHKEYVYVIYKGDDENKPFTHEDRKYLNMRVIKAIRDVESEMRNSKTSPLSKLIRQKYDIQKEDIQNITDELKKTGANTLNLPEITDLQGKINNLFNKIVAFGENEFEVSLKTMDIDASRILYALRPLIDTREASDTSLGVNNILYITLMFMLIQDNTIRTYLPVAEYNELSQKDGGDIVQRCYDEIDKGYILKSRIDQAMLSRLYTFLYEQNPKATGVTILAIEEPEAHLHPIYQRLLYKYIVYSSNAPTIITTHSTHISSVAPVRSIVHLINTAGGSQVHTTAGLTLSEKDIQDLERYVDVKRGEIYLAKGIIFVEGVAEEYLLPSFAKLLGYDLDRFGIIVCNVNSTNFAPYLTFASSLCIPTAIITDGDYYYIQEKKKIFGDMHSDSHEHAGYAGNERGLDLCRLFVEDEEIDELVEQDFSEQDQYLSNKGIFVGVYTLELDIFQKCTDADLKMVNDVFSELTIGGSRQKQNFENDLHDGCFPKCLARIESYHNQIGKGRFAQRLASVCTESMIPEYIEDAITYICERVRGQD